jgi:kumamolisin
MADSRTTLRGSTRDTISGGNDAGPIDPNERLTVLIEVRRSKDLPAAGSPRKTMSREELAAAHGASSGDLLAVRDFAAAHDLRVIRESAEKRTVEVSGTAESLAAAFGVKLRMYSIGPKTYRVRTGPITIPTALAPIVTAVLGLDDRPQAKPHYRRRDPQGMVAHAGGRAYTPPEVAKLYEFPNGDGAG